MVFPFGPFGKADRTSKSDGNTYYGYDDKDTGVTTWYDKDGIADCQTRTPSSDDDDDDDW